MIIGGVEKFSLLDYPEHLSAIVFTKGCNFRCQFCYNPMLVWPENELVKLENTPKIINGDEDGRSREGSDADQVFDEDGLFSFLKERIGKLDAVVVTGGEPTLHADLPEFMKKIKDLGYKVKLDTNGTNPAMVERVLEDGVADYLAMDIKGAPHRYDLVIGVQPNMENIRTTIGLLMASGLPYEFRTTVVPELVDLSDIAGIGEMIRGAEKWYLQKFKSSTSLVNKSFEGAQSHTDKTMEEMRKIASAYVGYCGVR